MDVLKDISNTSKPECSCATLTVHDIPGAILNKDPEKCKKNELELWLKCRGLSVKKAETKAKLCDRVRHGLNSGDTFKIVDPDPGNCHILRKKSMCNKCNVSGIPVSVPTSQNNVSNSKLHLPKDGWSRCTKDLPVLYSHIAISDHAKSSGKNQYVEKPIEKGYKFFFDGYVHSVMCCKNGDFTYAKAKCYRSQKKNELPHSLSVKLCSKSGSVVQGLCSCVAGVTGHCNHVFALLYAIDHTLKLKLCQFPLHSTCTEKPAEWTKSRNDGVSAEPIMECRVIKPRYGSNSVGIQPTLYEARGAAVANNSCDKAKELLDNLKSSDANCGIFSVLNVSNTSDVPTRMGFSAPQGSVLSYQLSVMESNFKVVENIDALGLAPNASQDMLNSVPAFPWTQNSAPDIDSSVRNSVNIDIDQDTAVELEKSTQEQNNSNRWFAERSKRLTASNYGLVLNRKTNKNELFVKNTLIGKCDLSNVAAVKYGLDNEKKAVDNYVKYMSRARNKVCCFKSGLVVNSNFPWAGASPDRKVFDTTYGLGLLEVKCAYRMKDIPPINACDDPSFFCEKNGMGLPKLKRTHHYYAQVQGQLGICGASWCDFVVYTSKGMTIERIGFDIDFWNTMMPKLHSFYVNHMIPVIKDLSHVN